MLSATRYVGRLPNFFLLYLYEGNCRSVIQLIYFTGVFMIDVDSSIV